MDYKKAIDILMDLLDKGKLSAEEKEALSAAVGLLDWASRAKSKIQERKARKEKSTEW